MSPRGGLALSSPGVVALHAGCPGLGPRWLFRVSVGVTQANAVVPSPAVLSAAKRRELDRPPLSAALAALDDGRLHRAAKLVATLECDASTVARPVRAAAGLSSIASRIAAGWNWPRFEELLQEPLFSELRPRTLDEGSPLPGLFAWSASDGCYVFIVSAGL